MMAMTRELVKKLLFCGAKSFRKYDLEKGHIWVYVGIEEPRKFELDVNYLNHPLFQDLLRHSVEEIGYSYYGALRITCEINLFLHLLELLRRSNTSVHYMELQLVKEKFYASCSQGCHHDQHLISS